MTPEQLAAMSPQLALLGPLVTAEAIERARRRLTHHRGRVEAYA